jgi:hypothetical protein
MNNLHTTSSKQFSPDHMTFLRELGQKLLRGAVVLVSRFGHGKFSE